MTTGLTITHVWGVPISHTRSVIPGVYVGLMAHRVNVYLIVDAETGGEYYVDLIAYECAYDMDRVRHGTAGKVLGSRIFLHAYLIHGSIDVEVRCGHWTYGVHPRWTTRDSDRINFELSCDWWIVRGYIDLNTPYSVIDCVNDNPPATR